MTEWFTGKGKEKVMLSAAPEPKRRGENAGTIVATLLTPIGSDFNKSNQASYIGTSYLLPLCCFTPLYGRLADILGRKGAMLLALFLFGTLFSLGSGTVICGMVPSMETLILARALAGMGGGGQVVLLRLALRSVLTFSQCHDRLFGLGAGIGGPLGGWINNVFGWRSAFFQAPLLIFSAILVTWKVNIQLPSDVQDQPLYEKLRCIDVLGSFTFLKTTEEIAWSHPLIYGLFVASFICGVLFIFVEKYWAPFPVMPLRLITRRTPFAVSLSNLFASMAAFSTVKIVLTYGPKYFSAVKLYSAASSGSHLLPHSIAISCGRVAAGWELYTLTLAAAASSICANFLVIFWNENTSQWHLWLDIVPQGFGMASFITTHPDRVIKEDMSVATGITYLFRATGQVLGVSLSGAILQATRTPQSHSAESIPVVDSYADALRAVFIFQAAMAFLVFLTCLPIERKPIAVR
ncbi:vacuolar amino acid permease [Mycena olivaceomarginata]|nr:vacuolar amino acid permease [Mycena olivaceomarginata]